VYSNSICKLIRIHNERGVNRCININCGKYCILYTRMYIYTSFVWKILLIPVLQIALVVSFSLVFNIIFHNCCDNINVCTLKHITKYGV